MRFLPSILSTLLLVVLLSPNVKGQESEPDQPLISRQDFAENTGFSIEYQFRGRSSMSLGLGYLRTPERCGRMWGEGIFLNNEIVLGDQNNSLLYSPQISAFYWSILFYGGVKLAYYTDFHQGTLQFAPEIGVGLAIVFVSYSRNIPIIPNDQIQPITDRLSLKLLLPSGIFF